MFTAAQENEIKRYMAQNGVTRNAAIQKLNLATISQPKKEIETKIERTVNNKSRVATPQAIKEQAKKEAKELEGREPICMLCLGEKGVGKTFTSLKFFEEVYTKTTPQKAGMKLLIFDTNQEFENVDPIRFQDIEAFKKQTLIEMRRLLPKDPETLRDLGMDGKADLLERLLDQEVPRNMGLFLEDYNSYVIGAQSKKMIDLLTTNRHKALDLFIHLQTFRAVPPRIWGNVNILRLHNTGDGCEQIKDKVKNYKMTKVANILVANKVKQDPRFYVYFNYDNKKITGKFTRDEIMEAAWEYIIEDEPRKVKTVMIKYGLKQPEAFLRLQNEIVDEFIISKENK